MLFQVATGAIYFVQFFVLIYFYRKRSRNADRTNVTEPVVFTFMRSFWALAVVAGILVYTVHPPLFHWSFLHLPLWARISGIVLGIISNGLLIWTVYSLGENLSASLSIREGHSLVVTGPYRFVRHPLYSCGILLFTALMLVSDSWIIGAAGIGFQLYIMIFRIDTEEAMMIKAFGDEYRRYMARTGRFMPKLI
jgi:protein-S-isoprenylcysteine O-methyltransferase Ste14